MSRPILIADEMEQTRCQNELQSFFDEAINSFAEYVRQGRLSDQRLKDAYFEDVVADARRALARWSTSDMQVECYAEAAQPDRAMMRAVLRVKWPPRSLLQPGTAVSTFLASTPPEVSDIKVAHWEGLTLLTAVGISHEELRPRWRGPVMSGTSNEPTQFAPDTLVSILGVDSEVNFNDALPAKELHDEDFAERMQRKRRKGYKLDE